MNENKSNSNNLIIDEELKKKILKDFKVNESFFDNLLDYFNKIIKPEIRNNYLSHLISSVEDIINGNRIKKFISSLKEENKEDATLKRLIASKNLRLFSIVLLPLEDDKKKASSRLFELHSMINYDPRIEPKQKRILIAHELGHIVLKLSEYEKFYDIEDKEKFASLFALISILDKEHFYNEEVKQYTYNNNDYILFNEVKSLLKI